MADQWDCPACKRKNVPQSAHCMHCNASRPAAASKVMVGAAVVGGVAGAVLAGPLVGVVAAGGAAYAATRSDKAGEAAKATGTAALAVGDKISQLDREHQVRAKVGDAAQSAMASMQELNQKHDVTGKVAGGISWAMNGITSALSSKSK